MLSVLLSLQGTAYHVRVSAYNMKGWGPPQASVPPFAIPSSEYPREHPHRSQHRAGGGQGSSLCHPRVPPTAGMGPSGPRGTARIWSLRPGREAVPGGLGCCLQPTGALPNSDFSALNSPCCPGKAEPFQATWISSSQRRSWEVAKSQHSECPGPGWQWPPTLCHHTASAMQPSPRDLHSLAWSWDGVMRPSPEQVWAVSTLLPMLAPGEVSGNSHPVSHQASWGAGWRRARRAELEGAGLRGAPEWSLSLVTSPKTGACVVSRGISAVNE